MLVTKSDLLNEIEDSFFKLGFERHKDLFYFKNRDGLILGVYLSSGGESYFLRIVPILEVFDPAIADALAETSGIVLKPLKSALYGEPYSGAEKSQSKLAAINFFARRPDFWDFKSERDLVGRKSSIVEATEKIGLPFLSGLRNSNDVARIFLSSPLNGPYTGLPSRYNQKYREVLRLICLRLLGRKDQLMSEYNLLYKYFKNIPDAKFRKRYEQFFRCFEPQMSVDDNSLK